MPVKVIAPSTEKIYGNVTIPLSKSESNRALMIKALAGFNLTDDVLSDSDDTITFKSLLTSNQKLLDAKDGGTTARFLITWCAFAKRPSIVTGSSRLQQRPFDDAIHIAAQLGCKINYLGNEGFLPIEIIPDKNTLLKEITCNAEKSSQHISALMMCAPLLKDGLTIHLNGETSSLPYLHLTANVMQHFGAQVAFKSKKIKIEGGGYNDIFFKAGGDWSAASYFYEIAALSTNAEIGLSGVDINSKQGDKAVIDLMKVFGCESKKSNDGIMVLKTKKNIPDYFTSDFIHTPDIALTLAATCSGLNVPADLHGLKNLRFKESDRVSVFQREIYKLNINTDFCDFSKLKIYNTKSIKPSNKVLQTHNDHRIAMCLAPLSLKTGYIFFDDDTVVTKSFPDYFFNLKKLGFEIEK